MGDPATGFLQNHCSKDYGEPICEIVTYSHYRKLGCLRKHSWLDCLYIVERSIAEKDHGPFCKPHQTNTVSGTYSSLSEVKFAKSFAESEVSPF